ncbi:MAG: hypothetical protein M1823_002120 [Watsoniomyces obsoletus]|nr:MAG: hypothetical protein M1823_002120 [Watsoniomyces obsoletus]
MDVRLSLRLIGASRMSKKLRLQKRGWPASSLRCFSCASRPAQQSDHSPSQRPSEPTTHFGYQTVAESQKEAKVGAVFSSVASSYDTMNDLMSLGIHRLWKDYFVRDLNPGTKPTFSPPPPSPSSSCSSTSSPPTPQGWNILDVAGGTGDIAFRLLDHSTDINHDIHTRVTVADINGDMLSSGLRRSVSTRYFNTPRLKFLQANAQSMPMIPSNSIDLYTVAFGIRNFTDKQAALREAYRVLKPGGVFACLEFSRPDPRIPLLETVYRRWSFGAIPLIGQLVAGDRDSYQYLVESIQKFPDQREFMEMIRKAGFSVPGAQRGEGGKGWVNLSGGIAAVHKGVKPVE